MEFKEVVHSRRSIRRYLDRPIPEDVLNEILDAGMYAPSAVDLQPWYFVVVKSKEQMERLYQIMGRVSDKIKPDLEARFAKHPEVAEESTRFLRQLGGAPVCILAFQFKPEYPKTLESIVQSVAAAIENMLLAATDKGLGSCWLTAPVETGMAAELRDTFAPGKGSLLAVLTLGYADQTPKTPARKTGRYVII